MSLAVKLEDYREIARNKLSAEIFEYIDGGACDEITKFNNAKAFDNITLRPLCLRDVSDVDPSSLILGKKLKNPIIIAPTACHQMVNQTGEIATAKAAKVVGVPMIVSTMSSFSLEEIAKTSKHDNLWLQTYIFKDKKITEELVLRAEKANYKALLITVGAPQLGKRDKNIRNNFSLHMEVPPGNFQTKYTKLLHEPVFKMPELDPSLTWKDIEWIKKITKLPIVIKGIMNPLDAKEACLLDIPCIIISNHGGRQLDTSEATIHVLPEIAEVVSERSTILLDGGIRRGTDVLKAIALGASGVLLGRPILWALATNGKKEVVEALNLLIDELVLSMRLVGCNDTDKIKKFSKQIISYMNYKCNFCKNIG